MGVFLYVPACDAFGIQSVARLSSCLTAVATVAEGRKAAPAGACRRGNEDNTAAATAAATAVYIFGILFAPCLKPVCRQSIERIYILRSPPLHS